MTVRVNPIVNNVICIKNRIEINDIESVKSEYNIKHAHQACSKRYVWNPSMCACECMEKCQVDKYWMNCTVVKNMKF